MPGEADEQKAAVLDAARTGSLAQLTAALEALSEDLPIELVCDVKGKTALHVAAQCNHKALCEHLIDALNCDVNVQNEEGDTPLALASFAGSEPAVDLLLARGADPNRHKQGSAGPLHRAALGGHSRVAQKLLEKGADVHGGAGAGAPLAWAAGAGREAVVEVLLAAGADPNGEGQNGVTPLLMAAAIGSLRSVQALVGAGAAVGTRGPGGVTALHVAANSGSVGMVECLMEAGAAADAVDEQGRTPAKVAAAAGHKQVVAAILRRLSSAGREGPVLRKEVGSEEEAEVQRKVEDLVSEMQEEVRKAEALRATTAVPAPEEPDEAAAEAERRGGNELFAAGRYAEAAARYGASLRHATDVAATWANRAACRLKLDQPEDALQDARMARTVDPNYVKAWYREGCAAEKLQRWEEAAAGYYEAYMLQPDSEEFALMMRRVVNKGRAANNKAPLGSSTAHVPPS